VAGDIGVADQDRPAAVDCLTSRTANLEVIMLAPATAVIASVFARVFPASSLQTEALKQVALFFAASLLVSLLSMTYGLDLSAGFF
jgi:hypothetical protein